MSMRIHPLTRKSPRNWRQKLTRCMCQKMSLRDITCSKAWKICLIFWWKKVLEMFTAKLAAGTLEMAPMWKPFRKWKLMMQTFLPLDIILDKEQTETFRKRKIPFFYGKILDKVR